MYMMVIIQSNFHKKKKLYENSQYNTNTKCVSVTYLNINLTHQKESFLFVCFFFL